MMIVYGPVAFVLLNSRIDPNVAISLVLLSRIGLPRKLTTVAFSYRPSKKADSIIPGMSSSGGGTTSTSI
ncbi:unnamed protein product [Musa acuminata subsp. burmannicoides]